MTSATEAIPSKLCVGYLEIHPIAYLATWHGHRLELSPTQFDVLSFLVCHRNRVASRAEIAAAAGLGHAPSVDVVLTSLRRSLGDGFVRNVRNRGWILEPDAFER